MITKLATDNDGFSRKFFMYNRARDGFSSLLKSLDFNNQESVLLPAYIGWSSREGSGVFDPVLENKLQYTFYAMDESLNIDLDSLKYAFDNNKIKLFVIIHYFGYVDPCYDQAISMAREYGVTILEDEAHSFFTNFIGGVSGRKGDASIFSLHKMFPISTGGMLTLNKAEKNVISSAVDIIFPFNFDFYSMSRKRIDNSILLAELLRPHSSKVTIMRPVLKSGEIPQTFPILINTVSRNKLYESMNDSGFGVVSLYHTMIENISNDLFPRSHFVASRILNLPVHQDIENSQINKMVSELLLQIDILEKNVIS
ncbi:DegT/DnrJ/EryC1/StrS family aminotransferase [Shewanella sp. TB4-MNA-CIBAN-0142]|uniref:DegT/DnrJ/EryC1/StrS family aminotransferase n=1 Tax=Shewanella sp. TB4-MNA-CIBAN-0142 TaxID=3140464 RepID=UPI003327DBB1